MLEWLLNHNFGALLIMVLLCLVAWILEKMLETISKK